jgi:hypothetical protein
MGLRIVPGSFCEIEPDTHKAICTCLSKLTICFYNAPSMHHGRRNQVKLVESIDAKK